MFSSNFTVPNLSVAHVAGVIVLLAILVLVLINSGLRSFSVGID